VKTHFIHKRHTIKEPMTRGRDLSRFSNVSQSYLRYLKAFVSSFF